MQLARLLKISNCYKVLKILKVILKSNEVVFNDKFKLGKQVPAPIWSGNRGRKMKD